MFQVAPNPTKVRLYLAEKTALGAEPAVEQVAVNLPEGKARTPEFRRAIRTASCRRSSSKTAPT